MGTSQHHQDNTHTLREQSSRGQTHQQYTCIEQRRISAQHNSRIHLKITTQQLSSSGAAFVQLWPIATACSPIWTQWRWQQSCVGERLPDPRVASTAR